MIASGKGHVMALGMSCTLLHLQLPALTCCPEPIFSCADTCTIFLHAGGGKLWTWAVLNVFDKSFYPLGRGNYQDSVPFPGDLSVQEDDAAQAIMRRPGLVSPAAFQHRDIVFIAAGSLYSIAVTEDGALYSWGGAETDPASLNCLPASDEEHVRNGYLGLGFTQSTNTPQRVGGSDFFDGAGVRQASCGNSHMLILTDDNRIWSVGSDADGQLGLDAMHCDQDGRCLVPAPVDMCHFEDKTVVLVAAGASHSAAVTQCGRMYVWGDIDILGGNRRTFAYMFLHNMSTPRRVPRLLFGGARVGLWNGCARARTLALAMALHLRLGRYSSAVFTDDVLFNIAHMDACPFDALGKGLLTLMGFRQS